MIFLKIYCNMDNLKIDNVNVEYNFMFHSFGYNPKKLQL